MSQSQSRKPRGLRAYLISLGATVLAAGAAGVAISLIGNGTGGAGFVTSVGLIGIAMAVGFALCVWWWRGIDEAAREAHKWAWWWGGTAGMAVGAVILLALMLGEDDAFSNTAANDLVASGMLAIVLFQIVGYGIAWAIWWLRRR